MVVAIDGPAGAGKSTTAKAVASELGFRHLDTGAMYRAVALVAAERAIEPLEASKAILIEPGPPLTIDGAAPGESLRTASVTEGASRVAGDPEVRKELVERQRQILAGGDWVVEGRDICTVVAPDAEVRIWLTASELERAKRRAGESDADVASVLEAQKLRDSADQGFGRSTLDKPEGSVSLDTTELNLDQVVAQIVQLVEEARS